MLLYEKTTFKIQSAIFTVYNALCWGHKEQVYQNALAKQFAILKLPFEAEPTLAVKFQGIKVGTYRPDFIVDDKIIVEIKAVEFMPRTFEIQLLHYLKTTDYQLGFLVNFGTSKLFIKRIINSKKIG